MAVESEKLGQAFLEGFIDRALAVGYTREQVPQLMKAANDLSTRIRHKEDFDTGFYSQMDKEGQFWRKGLSALRRILGSGDEAAAVAQGAKNVARRVGSTTLPPFNPAIMGRSVDLPPGIMNELRTAVEATDPARRALVKRPSTSVSTIPRPASIGKRLATKKPAPGTYKTNPRTGTYPIPGKSIDIPGSFKTAPRKAPPAAAPLKTAPRKMQAPKGQPAQLVNPPAPQPITPPPSAAGMRQQPNMAAPVSVRKAKPPEAAKPKANAGNMPVAGEPVSVRKAKPPEAPTTPVSPQTVNKLQQSAARGNRGARALVGLLTGSALVGTGAVGYGAYNDLYNQWRDETGAANPLDLEIRRTLRALQETDDPNIKARAWQILRDRVRSEKAKMDAMYGTRQPAYGGSLYPGLSYGYGAFQ